MSLTEPELLIQLFRVLQRRNKAVIQVANGELSLAESHLLTELECAGELSARDLCTLTCLSKQTVSRLLKPLITDKLIQEQPNPNDSRAKILRLSAKGARAVKEVDERANKTINSILTPLLKKEQKQLEKYFSLVADGYDVPKVKVRTSDVSIRAQIRRLTRAFGLISAGAFSTNVTTLDWHILAELDHTRTSMSAKDLAELLGAKQTTITQALHRLERSGALSKHSYPGDKRRSAFTPTEVGLKKLEHVNSAATRSMAPIVARFSQQEIKELVSLLTRVTDYSAPSDNLSIRVLKTNAELASARLLAVKFYSADASDTKLPQYLFHRDNSCFGCYEENELVASIEFVVTKNSWEGMNLVSNRGSLSAHLLKSFGKEVVKRIKQSHPGAKLSFHPSAALNKLT